VVFVFKATTSTFLQDRHNAELDACALARVGAELANMIPEKVFQHVVDAKDLLAAMTAGGIVNLWHVFPLSDASAVAWIIINRITEFTGAIVLYVVSYQYGLGYVGATGWLPYPFIWTSSSAALIRPLSFF